MRSPNAAKDKPRPRSWVDPKQNNPPKMHLRCIIIKLLEIKDIHTPKSKTQPEKNYLKERRRLIRNQKEAAQNMQSAERRDRRP